MRSSATVEAASSSTRGQWLGAQWAGLCSRECRAAQSRQPRPGKAQATDPGHRPGEGGSCSTAGPAGLPAACGPTTGTWRRSHPSDRARRPPATHGAAACNTWGCSLQHMGLQPWHAGRQPAPHRAAASSHAAGSRDSSGRDAGEPTGWWGGCSPVYLRLQPHPTYSSGACVM